MPKLIIENELDDSSYVREIEDWADAVSRFHEEVGRLICEVISLESDIGEVRYELTDTITGAPPIEDNADREIAFSACDVSGTSLWTFAEITLTE